MIEHFSNQYLQIILLAEIIIYLAITFGIALSIWGLFELLFKGWSE